jgi:hypothetical protein
MELVEVVQVVPPQFFVNLPCVVESHNISVVKPLPY